MVKWELVGWSEFGYRYFRTENNTVKRLPIPYIFTLHYGRYWW